MNPWVKKDANVPVICRPSGDNRRDVVRYQVADGTEGWFFCRSSRKAGTDEDGGWLTKRKERIKERCSFNNFQVDASSFPQ